VVFIIKFFILPEKIVFNYFSINSQRIFSVQSFELLKMSNELEETFEMEREDEQILPKPKYSNLILVNNILANASFYMAYSFIWTAISVTILPSNSPKKT
jgi:uncharacterized protein with HEPN domain